MWNNKSNIIGFDDFIFKIARGENLFHRTGTEILFSSFEKEMSYSLKIGGHIYYFKFFGNSFAATLQGTGEDPNSCPEVKN